MKKSPVSTKQLVDGIRLMESNPKLPFGNEERKRASVDLTLTYLSRYYADWRLAKILTIKKLLSTRYDFYNDIITETKQWDDSDGDSTIAQEIRNGLYFDAIAECIQYVEDLFALLKASQKPDFFIQNIITYDARKIVSYIKDFKPSAISISKSFFIPKDIQLENNPTREKLDIGINNLTQLVTDLIVFYKDYKFFYNQYKHGLSVAMRPLGNKYNVEQIESDKRGEFDPYLAVFDNFDLDTASKAGRFTTDQPALMIGMTENVMPFVARLHDEKNYLRLAFPPDNPNFSIELLTDHARKAKMCLHTFIANYSRFIKPEGNIVQFQLPVNYVTNEYMTCSYDKSEAQ